MFLSLLALPVLLTTMGLFRSFSGKVQGSVSVCVCVCVCVMLSLSLFSHTIHGQATKYNLLHLFTSRTWKPGWVTYQG